MQNKIPSTKLVMDLTHYLEHFEVSAEEFALAKGIYLNALEIAISEERLFVVGSNLYYKATQYSPSLKLGKRPVPKALSKHISTSFGGDHEAFAKKHGDSVIFVKGAADNGGIWVAREILLPYSLPKAYPMVSLQSHIESDYEDNAAEFGRLHGRSQQQVHRWKLKNAGWCKGNVYLKRTDFNPDLLLTNEAKQAVLFTDYLFGGYFLPASERISIAHNPNIKDRHRTFKRLFKEMFIKYSNQIDRYISYPDTMWVEGDIYKKQSDW